MQNLYTKINVILESSTPMDDRLQKVCQLLSDEITYFNWVGFYFKNGDRNELKLGPYVGAETDHTIIPYGKGICGQVAESNETFLVPDVYAQDNYLACSIETKAEVVVPIIKDGVNIGQIDIDSHMIDPFTESDVEMLTYICEKIADII